MALFTVISIEMFLVAGKLDVVGVGGPLVGDTVDEALEGVGGPLVGGTVDEALEGVGGPLVVGTVDEAVEGVGSDMVPNNKIQYIIRSNSIYVIRPDDSRRLPFDFKLIILY